MREAFSIIKLSLSTNEICLHEFNDYLVIILMKRNLLILFFLFLLSNSQSLNASKSLPDTVYTGVYITSIQDIDFKEEEYTVSFWLWLKYKNREFDFLQNLEIPQAKTLVKSFSTIDSTNKQFYILMKLQCVMKDSWQIGRFPFDHQKLRLAIENSQFDSQSLVFAPDKLGKNYDPEFTLHGWIIDSLRIASANKSYETNFGDEELKTPHSNYSSLQINLAISREAMGLFWKMFLGLYIAFLIAFVCFFIDAGSVELRFGLSVGALFAAVGNKYVIDSTLPESTTFTLVDTLHGLTLLCIFAVIASTIYSLRLVNKNEVEKANKFDRIFAQILLFVYIALNIYYISNAGLYY